MAISNGTFPPEGAGRFSPQKCGTGRVSTAKSGRDPDWAILSSTRIAVLAIWVLRRLKGCRQFRATQALRWLVDRFTLPCDRGIITNKHITCELFLDNGESYVFWRKCCAKVSCLSWMSYIVALCSSCSFFFFIWFFSRLHYVGLLWGHDAKQATVL